MWEGKNLSCACLRVLALLMTHPHVYRTNHEHVCRGVNANVHPHTNAHGRTHTHTHTHACTHVHTGTEGSEFKAFVGGLTYSMNSEDLHRRECACRCAAVLCACAVAVRS